MLKTPISVQFVDAKELFTAQTIAITPYILLSEATPDEATIPTCIDFNLSLSAIQENAENLELYREYIIKQIQLRLGVQGAAMYTVRLLGAEGKVALAFPSLAKQIFDDLVKGLVPERIQGVEKEQAKEGGGSLAKEGYSGGGWFPPSAASRFKMAGADGFAFGVVTGGGGAAPLGSMATATTP